MGQKILFLALVTNLVFLALLVKSNSGIADGQVQKFTSTQSKSAAIVYTEHETLIYTVKFAQWSGGQTTRHEVQVARALLSERLQVINDNGHSLSQEVTPEYKAALSQTDKILASAPEGILPEYLHSKVKADSAKALREIINQTRLLIVQYQQQIDLSALKDAKDRSSRSSLDLIFLLTSILLGAGFFAWVGISLRNHQKKSRQEWEEEAEVLRKFEADLKDAEYSVESLKELNATKNDFISTINHELRTPLTSIVGYIDLLKEYASNDTTGEMAKIISVVERNSESLLSIVESILSLSKLDSKESNAEFENVYLPQIIERKKFILSPLTTAKSITIDFTATPGVEFAILGTPSQISQVVLNLLSNAVKFSPAGSHVEIILSTRRNDLNEDLIRMEIKDQGIGIPQEDIPKLFTRFYRAGNAVSNNVSGTGLGLAIVARILELHGATVQIDSTINVGTSFIVEFSRHVTDVDRLISVNRIKVLRKAIIALNEAAPEELKSVSHQMSGALGFYALEAEMYLTDNLQNWLEANPDATLMEIQIKKDVLVKILETSLEELIDQKEEK